MFTHDIDGSSSTSTSFCPLPLHLYYLQWNEPNTRPSPTPFKSFRNIKTPFKYIMLGVVVISLIDVGIVTFALSRITQVFTGIKEEFKRLPRDANLWTGIDAHPPELLDTLGNRRQVKDV